MDEIICCFRGYQIICILIRATISKATPSEAYAKQSLLQKVEPHRSLHGQMGNGVNESNIN
jgi:hypothetical protein